METLPAVQDTNTLALHGPALLEQWERLERAVAAEREKKALEEGEAREARSRAWEERQQREYLFIYAGEGDRRRRERVAAADEAHAIWQKNNAAMEAEIRALEEELRRQVALCRRKWQAIQGEAAHAAQLNAEALLASHREAFEKEYPALLARARAADQARARGESPQWWRQR